MIMPGLLCLCTEGKSRLAVLCFIRIRLISPRIISPVGRDDWTQCLSEDVLCLAIDFLSALSAATLTYDTTEMGDKEGSI